MKRILGFKLETCLDRDDISMPVGAKLLDIQLKDNYICIWALCDEDAPTEIRRFVIYTTGDLVPDSRVEYVGTLQIPRSWVYHVFEVV